MICVVVFKYNSDGWQTLFNKCRKDTRHFDYEEKLYLKQKTAASEDYNFYTRAFIKSEKSILFIVGFLLYVNVLGSFFSYRRWQTHSHGILPQEKMWQKDTLELDAFSVLTVK